MCEFSAYENLQNVLNFLKLNPDCVSVFLSVGIFGKNIKNMNHLFSYPNICPVTRRVV